MVCFQLTSSDLSEHEILQGIRQRLLTGLGIAPERIAYEFFGKGGSLAVLAKELGHRVTGSDANVYPPMSTQLEAQGIELLQSTIATNPTYANAQCLLAFAAGYLLPEPDPDTARTAGKTCLTLDPPADMIPLVQQLLDELG